MQSPPIFARSVLLALFLALGACGGGGGSKGATPAAPPAAPGPTDPAPPVNPPTPPPVNPPPIEPPPALPAAAIDWDRDILLTALEFNLADKEGTATITLAGSESEAASFEIGDLTITQVTAVLLQEQHDLNFTAQNGALHVGLPASNGPSSLSIQYTYSAHDDFDGAMSNGQTFIWPYFCGNLFPCKSTPAEGTRFTLALSGVPDDQRALFPAEITADAPAYMLAWAIGDYEYLDLGSTAAGTQVGAWHTQGNRGAAIIGTRPLRDSFEWLEATYGAYPFGFNVASVSTPFDGDSFGGIEHHPLWHIAEASMADPEAHVHEAAHGWFGNGVRIACWEDFVLSEGLATYLAARGIEQSTGSADAVWASYTQRLNRLQSSSDNKIAWPTGCGDIDILNDGLFSDAPYVKGAFFMRSVENNIGRSELDAVLSLFYTRHVGEAQGMQDLLDLIETQSGWDPSDCAQVWLRSADLSDASALCP